MSALVTKGEYSCRLLKEDDWQACRAIRLRMIEGAPEHIYQPVTNHSEEYWRKQLSSSERKTFGLIHKNELIGSTEIILMPDKKMKFTGSYILEEHRGKGLGDLLYAARFDYAIRQKEYNQITLDIREGNTKSQAVAIRNGFVKTDQYLLEKEAFVYTFSLDKIRYPDGARLASRSQSRSSTRHQ